MSRLETTVLIAAALIIALVGWAVYVFHKNPACMPNGAGCGAPPSASRQ